MYLIAHLVFLVFVAATTVQGGLPLPDFIKPCSRNDPKLNECALEIGKTVPPHLKDGLPKYRVPVLEPLFIKEIKIDQDENRGFGINLVATDINVHGIADAEVRNISVRVEPPLIWCKFFVPRVEFEGKYKVDGKILVLPIQGNGDANITLVNLDLGFNIEGEWVEKKDGKKYMKISNHHINYNMDRNHIRLENLFNGNKALGDRMNEFMDVNWREVTDELGPPIAEALGVVIKSIMAGIVEQVAFDEIFPEKV